MYDDIRYREWEARELESIELEILKGIDSAKLVPLVLFESSGFGPPPKLPTNLSIRTAR